MPRIALAALALFLARPALAYRPFVTEDANVAAYRRFELETSWDRLDWANGDADDAFLIVNTYGAARNLEVAVETTFLSRRFVTGGHTSGLGDFTFTSKLQLSPERDGHPAALLKGFVKPGNASHARGLGSGTNNYGLAAVASKTLGALSLHGMAGYAIVDARVADHAKGMHFFGAAADYTINKRLSAAAELHGNRRLERDGLPDPLAAYLGAIVELSPTIFLDAGVRRGLSRTAPRWQGVLGLFAAF